jgi:hypothetical protein
MNSFCSCHETKDRRSSWRTSAFPKLSDLAAFTPIFVAAGFLRAAGIRLNSRCSTERLKPRRRWAETTRKEWRGGVPKEPGAYRVTWKATPVTEQANRLLSSYYTELRAQTSKFGHICEQVSDWGKRRTWLCGGIGDQRKNFISAQPFLPCQVSVRPFSKPPRERLEFAKCTMHVVFKLGVE